MARIVHAGRRFAPADVKAQTFHDKPARRIARAKARKGASRIEVKLAAAQLVRAEASEASSNSHAARRLLERERAAKVGPGGEGHPAMGVGTAGARRRG